MYLEKSKQPIIWEYMITESDNDQSKDRHTPQANEVDRGLTSGKKVLYKNRNITIQLMLA